MVPDETNRWHREGTKKGRREEQQVKASGRAKTRFSCCRFEPEAGQESRLLQRGNDTRQWGGVAVTAAVEQRGERRGPLGVTASASLRVHRLTKELGPSPPLFIG